MANGFEIGHQIDMVISSSETVKGIEIRVIVNETETKKYTLKKVLKNKELFDVNLRKEAVNMLAKHIKDENNNVY